jgi:HlyD family secretion protein
MRWALVPSVPVLIAAAGCGGGARGALTVSGTAEVTEVRVASVLPGRLVLVPLQEGQPVKKGDVVFVLDTADLIARREVADAVVNQASAAWDVARSQKQTAEEQVVYVEKEYKRIEGLAASGSVSGRDLSAAENQQTLARAALRTATQALDTAAAAKKQAESARAAIDVSLSEARVLSPIDGVVLSRLREPGEVVTPGGAVAILGDVSRPWVRVYVPVTRLGEVKIGGSAKVSTDGGDRFDATVVHVADQAEFTPRDVQTPEERVKQVFSVKLDVQDREGRLKAGMPVDVTFTKS